MNLVIHYVHDVMVVLQVSNLKVKMCNAFKLQVPLVVTLFYCLETMRQQIENQYKVRTVHVNDPLYH